MSGSTATKSDEVAQLLLPCGRSELLPLAQRNHYDLRVPGARVTARIGARAIRSDRDSSVDTSHVSPHWHLKGYHQKGSIHNPETGAGSAPHEKRGSVRSEGKGPLVDDRSGGANH